MARAQVTFLPVPLLDLCSQDQWGSHLEESCPRVPPGSTQLPTAQRASGWPDQEGPDPVGTDVKNNKFGLHGLPLTPLTIVPGLLMAPLPCLTSLQPQVLTLRHGTSSPSLSSALPYSPHHATASPWQGPNHEADHLGSV